MEKYETRLKTVFDEAGVEFIQTQLGKLKKVQGENGSVAFSLDL